MNALKPLTALFAIAGGLLSGCQNPMSPASIDQDRGVTVSVRSSASVRVASPRLQMNQGKLELAGAVAKQPGASTTAFSHLDILFFDAAGHLVEMRPLRFTPHSVGHGRFGSRFGHYALTVEPIPGGIARIEVEADDRSHATPHS